MSESARSFSPFPNREIFKLPSYIFYTDQIFVGLMKITILSCTSLLPGVFLYNKSEYYILLFSFSTTLRANMEDVITSCKLLLVGIQ